MTATELLFLLLRSEICADAKVEFSDSLSEEELKDLYALSNAHDVAHIISDTLQKKGLLGEDEASKKFLKSQLLSIYLYEQLKYAFDEICSLFEKRRRQFFI